VPRLWRESSAGALTHLPSIANGEKYGSKVYYVEDNNKQRNSHHGSQQEKGGVGVRTRSKIQVDTSPSRMFYEKKRDQFYKTSIDEMEVRSNGRRT